tara:strand:+ start:3138 stop:3788 length:651 start_codon:yes stop_codon:yes gene_type:complete
MKLTFKDIINEEIKIKEVKEKIKKILPRESKLYSGINTCFFAFCIISFITFVTSMLFDYQKVFFISFPTFIILFYIFDSYVSNQEKIIKKCNEKKLPKRTLLYLLRKTRKINFDSISENLNKLDMKEKNIIDVIEEKNIYKNKNKKIKIEVLKEKIKSSHVEELENNIELIKEYTSTLNKNNQKEINKLIKQKRSENYIDLFKEKEVIKKENKILI